MNRRLSLAVLSIAALSCTGQRSAGVHAAAAVEPTAIGCAAGVDCSWVLGDGACMEIARRLELPGPYVDVRMSGLHLGANVLPWGSGQFSVTLREDWTFDWTAPSAVSFVVATGAGNGSNVYRYDPPLLLDDTLAAPTPPLAQVLFCLPPPEGLAASVTAGAGFSRTWGWSIAKSSPTASVTAATGATAQALYLVTVDAAPVDAAWLATGTLTVQNTGSSLADQVEIVGSVGGVSFTPDCGGFGGTLAGGATLTCTWSAPLPAGVDATAVVTVSWGANQSSSSSSSVVRTAAAGRTSVSASAPVIFGGPTSQIDPCVVVTDDRAGTLGTVCAAAAPATFTYALSVGPYGTCDASGAGYPFSNTASFRAPSGATGSATAMVRVLVPCASAGCTLTQGYWKTHSEEGPAPYDPRWRNVGPLEEDTPFYASGQSWIGLFGTPVRGSAYVALAHQYMAARLNVLAGASSTALGDALATAEAFFAANGPATPLTAAARAQLLALADLLDRFNSGLIGPGHCDDVEPGAAP